MADAKANRAVQVLDLLLESFGEDGAHWTRDRYHDGRDRRCLVGALYYLRRKHRISSEDAEYFLLDAMRKTLPHRTGGLVYFNDKCRSFVELRSLIKMARRLALRDGERGFAAAAFERWLLSERERAVRAAASDSEVIDVEPPVAPERIAA